ncbi:MAG: DUF4292 domain-containing protein [Bacteroidia bacterium]|nr:DUF4292 domain-containing protein [Bacteroidia bacterium]MCX7763672.1 DUF4292 domain-containing protein [Bacteroidia bacterium]MDW8058300.1 DUF4292 domain-containing protein [Bacteroidia bacterium]
MERAAIRWYIPFLMGALLLSGGCPRAGVKTPRSKAAIHRMESAEAILQTIKARHSFPNGTAFRLKYQAEYEGERKQSFQLRIIGKDSVLWMSAGIMGFEGLRILWRQDSIFILNRLAREAFIGPVDSLRTFLPPVGAGDFLALLLGYFPPSLEKVHWVWSESERKLRGALTSYTIEAFLSEALEITEWQLSYQDGSVTLKYELPPSPTRLPYPKVALFLPLDNVLYLTPKEVEQNASESSMPFTIPEGYAIKPLSSFGL